jgi:hypothetical protein
MGMATQGRGHGTQTQVLKVSMGWGKKFDFAA